MAKAGTSFVLGLVVLALTANQAGAATIVSQATANAIGGNLLDTGTCTATNDGTQASPGTVTGGATCTTGGPGSSQSLLSAAVLVADPIATNVGGPSTIASSFSCAGVTGPGGGAVQVGPSDPCTVNSGTGQGVNLLGGLITADAIFATCSDVNGVLTGASTLANASVGGLLSGLLGTVTGLGPLTLPLDPLLSLNQPVSISVLGVVTPLLTITANTQSTVAGQITVNALTVTVLPGLVTFLGALIPGLTAGLTISIGNVTCGPNAVIAAVPAFPLKGLPIAGVVVAIVGGAAWIKRRQLFGTPVG